MASGATRVVKSSTYTNEILIDGFPDTKPQTVKLYAVSKAEVVSDPVDVIVEPKTPIFNLVFGGDESNSCLWWYPHYLNQ
jgi:hypothetical protein